MKNKKILIPEDLPEFQQAIDALTPEQIKKVEKMAEKAEQKKDQGWWNKFLYSMKIKGALITHSIENHEQRNQTGDHKLPAAGAN